MFNWIDYEENENNILTLTFEKIIDAAETSSEIALQKVIEHYKIKGKKSIPVSFNCSYSHIHNALQANEIDDSTSEQSDDEIEAHFPGCQALFTFDNALSYAAFLPNILVAKYLEESSQRCTAHILPKGLKQVLMERRLWLNKGLKLEEARKLMKDSGWEDENWVNERTLQGPNGTYTVAVSNTKNITGYFSPTKDSNNNTSLDTADEVLEFLNNRNEEDG
ncbi:4094_t:CDS:2 [Funneliformis caledonium]|uniref:4094_t:CDS:1 n=1 Tax=Funneliformis caledonium TaxID=1117310 RepID=A0A9N9FSR5_9GLOM|nr:4094_t:CDS:2 [Funneliformis caledonium]